MNEATPQEEWPEPELNYLVLSYADPRVLCAEVSRLRTKGWELHGEMKMQAAADPSSVTMSRLYYLQALYLPV